MPTVRVEEAGGFELSYAAVGSGPAVLWIHGGMGGPRTTLGQEVGMAARGRNPAVMRLIETGRYRVITYDRRGCGDSEYVTDRYYTVHDLAAEARGLLRALGVEHLEVLIGTSMGGVVAQQFALDYPTCFSKLVLLNTSPVMMAETIWGPALEKTHQRCLVEGERAVFSAERLRKELLAGADDGTRARVEAATDEALFRLWQGERRNESAFLGYDYRPRLRHIKKPCLIVHGDRDPIVPHKHGLMLSSGIKGAALLTVPGAGHGIWMTPQCIAAIPEWLETGKPPAIPAKL